MAGLADLKLSVEEVTLANGGKITVRGLSFYDFTRLWDDHGTAVSAVFAEVTQRTLDDDVEYDETGQPIPQGITNAVVRDALISAARGAPEAGAQASVLASDEDGNKAAYEVARRLPMSDQVQVLFKVFELTFVSEDEVKKVMETVARAMTGLSRLTVIAAES